MQYPPSKYDYQGNGVTTLPPEKVWVFPGVEESLAEIHRDLEDTLPELVIALNDIVVELRLLREGLGEVNEDYPEWPDEFGRGAHYIMDEEVCDDLQVLLSANLHPVLVYVATTE